MVETAQREGETYYTPERIGYWLEHWQELRELSIRTPGAILPASSPSAPRGSRRSDPLRYCDIMADIERAALGLPRWSLEFQVVEWSMRDYDLAEIAGGLHVSYGAAYRALGDASEAMARRLGWDQSQCKAD